MVSPAESQDVLWGSGALLDASSPYIELLDEPLRCAVGTEIDVLRLEGCAVCPATGVLVCLSCGVGICTPKKPVDAPAASAITDPASAGTDITDADGDPAALILSDLVNHVRHVHKLEPKGRLEDYVVRARSVYDAFERVTGPLLRADTSLYEKWQARMKAVVAKAVPWAPVEMWHMCPLCSWGARVEERRTEHIKEEHGEVVLTLAGPPVPAQVLFNTYHTRGVVVVPVEVDSPRGENRGGLIDDDTREGFFGVLPPGKRSLVGDGGDDQAVSSEGSPSTEHAISGVCVVEGPGKKRALVIDLTLEEEITQVPINTRPTANGNADFLWTSGALITGDSDIINNSGLLTLPDRVAQSVTFLKGQGYGLCPVTGLLVCVSCRIGVSVNKVPIKGHERKHNKAGCSRRAQQIFDASGQILNACSTNLLALRSMWRKRLLAVTAKPLAWAQVQDHYLCPFCPWGSSKISDGKDVVKRHLKRYHSAANAPRSLSPVPAQLLTQTVPTGIVIVATEMEADADTRGKSTSTDGVCQEKPEFFTEIQRRLTTIGRHQQLADHCRQLADRHQKPADRATADCVKVIPRNAPYPSDIASSVERVDHWATRTLVGTSSIPVDGTGRRCSQTLQAVEFLKSEGLGICTMTGLLVCVSCGVGLCLNVIKSPVKESPVYLHYLKFHGSHASTERHAKFTELSSIVEHAAAQIANAICNVLLSKGSKMIDRWREHFTASIAPPVAWAPVQNFYLCPAPSCRWGTQGTQGGFFSLKMHIKDFHGSTPFLISKPVPAQCLVVTSADLVVIAVRTESCDRTLASGFDTSGLSQPSQAQEDNIGNRGLLIGGETVSSMVDVTGISGADLFLRRNLLPNLVESISASMEKARVTMELAQMTHASERLLSDTMRIYEDVKQVYCRTVDIMQERGRADSGLNSKHVADRSTAPNSYMAGPASQLQMTNCVSPVSQPEDVLVQSNTSVQMSLSLSLPR